MPPKPRVPPARYKTGMAYFKAAYRARIKELVGQDWTTGQITSTLAWMWLHASDEEKQQSIELWESRSQDLPTVDETTIPNVPKTTQDQGPVRDPPHRDEGVRVIGESEASSAPSTARVNTTAFHYLPDLETLKDDLPNIEESNEEDDAEEQNAKERRWLAAGLFYPDKERNGQRWYGAQFLGQGSTGRVGLWVGSNDTKVIQDKLAVRDVAVGIPDRWINPLYWRDRLPRELAIQVRLNKRKGHDHHVHRYYAHRVNFWQRRYRVFNEMCDFGNLADALDWYSRLWRRRRNMFKWISNHTDIAKATDALKGSSGKSGSHEVHVEQLKRANNKAWKRQLRQRKRRGLRISSVSAATDEIRLDDDNNRAGGHSSNEDDPFYEDYENMSDLNDWHAESLPEKLPEVIPESFLWTVFNQLVDAFTLLGTGRVGEVNEQDGEKSTIWNEIVHRDVHLGNIFVKPAKKAKGMFVQSDATSRDHRFESFRAKDAPSVVLADFDMSFFDLQSAGDPYADNPLHYILRDSPLEVPEVGGRYPPELFWDYTGHTEGTGEKLTSKTDVWALGQVMWNLVMNLPGNSGDWEQPFFHFANKDNIMQEQKLVNGQPYDIIEYRNHLFSGRTPFEASAQYSDRLKDTIYSCLHYRQENRASLAQLKLETEEWAGKDVPTDSKALGDVIIRVPGEMEKFAIGGEWPLDERGHFKKQRRSEERRNYEERRRYQSDSL